MTHPPPLPLQRPLPLHGKVALVTGGAARVGAAISRELAARGASVVVHYLRSEKGTLDLNRTLGRGVFSLRGDLSDADTRDWIFREACDWMGRVDILVNNAAVFAPDDQLDPALARAVNLDAPLHLTRLLAAQPSGGTAIHLLDSWITHINDPAYRHYAATKRELAERLPGQARQYAPQTRVNGVAPGPVLLPAARNEPAGNLLLARRPGPQDVAHAVAFLAENEAVTGQVIQVDGGQFLSADFAD